MEFERKKNEIEQNYHKEIKNLNQKFGFSGVDFIEEHLQTSASGLVSRKDLKKKNEQIELLITKEEEKLLEKEKDEEVNKRMQKLELKKHKNKDLENKLSFADELMEEDEEEFEPKPKRRCYGKNPDVNTNFLSVLFL